MFEDFANPPKGKGKEKDVGKRRAYVRVITSLGGGLNLELYCEKVSSIEICERTGVDILCNFWGNWLRNIAQKGHPKQLL